VIGKAGTARAIVRIAVREFGRIDVLLSNTGICPFHAFLSTAHALASGLISESERRFLRGPICPKSNAISNDIGWRCHRHSFDLGPRRGSFEVTITLVPIRTAVFDAQLSWLHWERMGFGVIRSCREQFRLQSMEEDLASAQKMKESRMNGSGKKSGRALWFAFDGQHARCDDLILVLRSRSMCGYTAIEQT